jgi:ubiquinone/menaquinone biosynthesis C-methylase UbiE
MGLIFDIPMARLYESWYKSHGGKAMQTFLEKSLIELLGPQAGERVLDIGCGTGNHLLLLNKSGLDITGTDASPYMLTKARERLGNRCVLKTGTAEELPFSDNEFDIVVLINTLEFLDNPLKVLQEVGRVAKRKVFIGVINPFSPYYIYSRLIALYKKSIIDHIKPYGLWELKHLLRAAYGKTPLEWKSSWINHTLCHKTENLMSSICDISRLPFGFFLGVSATITYRYKTDNLPLKVRIKKTEQSVANGISATYRNSGEQE